MWLLWQSIKSFPQIILLQCYLFTSNTGKFTGNGRTARNALDASLIVRRKQREKKWMLKLRAIYLSLWFN